MSSDEKQAASSTLSPISKECGPVKILMIEDNWKDVELIRETLATQEEMPFELDSADRLASGLKRLTENPPDVILLDLSLPDGKGLEVFDKLRALNSDLPIIALTGNDDERIAISAMRKGAQDYLVKGKVDRGLLLRAIRYAMERQRLMLDVIAEKKDGEIIRASLKEKDVLLKEIHHRVKNNMQIISSLLNLHAGFLKDKRDLAIFKDCQSKIKSMALIHEILYQSENLATINFADYIRKLVSGLLHSYGIESGAMSLQVHAENVFLGVDIAIPCGLIVNELVSNSVKHAFRGKADGKISIDFSQDSATQIVTVVIKDNGVGFRENFDIHKTESLGLQLVTTLTSQLSGTIEISKGQGAEIKVTFPTPEK